MSGSQTIEEAIHDAAADGYARAADAYQRGRPDYPSEVAAWLRERLSLGPGKDVLDLGAGTGKFTRRLLETGARVAAVEPVEAMRTRLAGACPEVECRAGTAEAIPFADGSFDAVVCAQAFHWFAGPRSLAEILRVLVRGGRLGLIWNSRDSRVPWVARLDALVDRYEGDAPRFHSGAWRAAFPFPGLAPLDEDVFSFVHVGSPEDVIVNRVKSTSFIAALPPSGQAAVVDEVRAIVASEPTLADRDEVAMPYRTYAFAFARKG